MYEYCTPMTQDNRVHVEVENNAASVRATFGDAIKIFIASHAFAPLHHGVISLLRLTQDPAVVFTDTNIRETIFWSSRDTKN